MGHFIPSAWAPHNFYLFKFGTTHGEEKLGWLKRVIGEYWPEPLFFLDDWADLMFGALCGAAETVERVSGLKIDVDYPWWEQVVATGCASSGKSSRAAMWILLNWTCAQEHTSCILTSTSMDQLKRRIWSELIDWIAKSKRKFPLEIVASETLIRWNERDTKSAIFGRAVDQGGSVDNAVGRIKGVHNSRMFVVLDEQQTMPEAISKACRNLESGTKEFQFIGLGNATDRNDQHGLASEPVDGWESITVSNQAWLTKMGGIAIHLDGHSSPALKDPVKYHFYVNRKKLDKDARFFGGENTPEYWRENRGFWTPTGLSSAVMDGALLAQFHTSDKAVWGSDGFEMGGLLDPAFEGGDRRILYPCRIGKFANGVMGIEYLPPINVAVDMTQDVRWIHYSVADAVQAQCEGYQINGKPFPILPQNVIMDTTGEGGGLFSVLSGRWSPLINACEFGGAADKTQISPDRPTTWHELYANRVTMLWYAMRRFIEGDQVRGLTDPETIMELTSRDKFMRNGKTCVVPKKEMKIGKSRSPDKADSFCLGGHLLRMKGILPAGQTGGEQLDPTEWNRFADRVNLDATSGDYLDAGAAFAE